MAEGWPDLIRVIKLEQRHGDVAEDHALDSLEPKASGRIGRGPRHRHRRLIG